MNRPDDEKDVRPDPDPTALTTKALDREINHLKELLGRDRDAEREARKVALEGEREARRVALDAMDRRLLELPELRTEIIKVRNEFVRGDVYVPAHEELRRQRYADGERMVGHDVAIKQNATDIAELKSSLMWLSRLVIGAVIVALIAFGFRALTGR